MMTYYIEVDGKPVPVTDVQEWGEWFHNNDRSVAKTKLPNGTRISTVFLGLDHSYPPGGALKVYETMAFDGEGSNSLGFCERYSTREEAKEGHDKIVQYLKALYGC